MKAEGGGLVGSLLIITGIVATAVADEMPPAWGPCKSELEGPQLTGTAVEGVANGDCAGNVGAVEVALATGDCRPGNMASPGVEDLCAVGTDAGAGGQHLLAEAGDSEFRLGRDDNEASPLVTADGKAEEFIKCVSFDVRKPFKADRRGLFTLCGPAALAITEGVGVGMAWDAGGKGKGRPAKTDDRAAVLGLLADPATELAKEWLVNGAQEDANVSLEARVTLGVELAWGDGVRVAEGPGSGIRPEKMEGPGAGVVLWAEVTGAVGTEGVRSTVGLGVDG